MPSPPPPFACAWLSQRLADHLATWSTFRGVFRLHMPRIRTKCQRESALAIMQIIQHDAPLPDILVHHHANHLALQLTVALSNQKEVQQTISALHFVPGPDPCSCCVADHPALWSTAGDRRWGRQHQTGVVSEARTAGVRPERHAAQKLQEHPAAPAHGP